MIKEIKCFRAVSSTWTLSAAMSFTFSPLKIELVCRQNWSQKLRFGTISSIRFNFKVFLKGLFIPGLQCRVVVLIIFSCADEENEGTDISPPSALSSWPWLCWLSFSLMMQGLVICAVFSWESFLITYFLLATTLWKSLGNDLPSTLCHRAAHFWIKVLMVRTEGTFLCFALVPKFIEFQDALKVIVNCFIYRNGLFTVVVSAIWCLSMPSNG